MIASKRPTLGATPFEGTRKSIFRLKNLHAQWTAEMRSFGFCCESSKGVGARRLSRYGDRWEHWFESPARPQRSHHIAAVAADGSLPGGGKTTSQAKTR